MNDKVRQRKNQDTQTEQQQKPKTAVYEKVDNDKRCELIRIVSCLRTNATQLQQKERSLRETSDLLGINYSTAKTIVQTFRRERRIAKKPKHFFGTRKAIKKEKFLQKVLSKRRVDNIVSQILEGELMLKSFKEGCKEEAKEVSPLAATKATQEPGPNPPLAVSSNFPSALSMVQISADEEGPTERLREGQISRATWVKEEQLLPTDKKPAFFVYSEHNLDEDYKQSIDYNDPVPLRQKAKEDIGCVEAPAVSQAPPLPSLQRLLSDQLGEYHRDGQGEEGIIFNFQEYREPMLEPTFIRQNRRIFVDVRRAIRFFSANGPLPFLRNQLEPKRRALYCHSKIIANQFSQIT